jgi:hypothetical protein
VRFSPLIVSGVVLGGLVFLLAYPAIISMGVALYRWG